jgi:TonB family protein
VAARIHFGWALAASLLLHGLALALTLALVSRLGTRPETLAVYTVRVVEQPRQSGNTQRPAPRAADASMGYAADVPLRSTAAAATGEPDSNLSPTLAAPEREPHAPPATVRTVPVSAQAPVPAASGETQHPVPALAFRQAAAGNSLASPSTFAPDGTDPSPLPAKDKGDVDDRVTVAPDPSVAATPNGPGTLLPWVEVQALDAGFGLIAPVTLAYPEAARRARKAGRVRLEVEVGADGSVLAVRVLEATAGWGFAEAARDAYQRARFAPPRWQGRPVRVLWRKTLLFQP